MAQPVANAELPDELTKEPPQVPVVERQKARVRKPEAKQHPLICTHVSCGDACCRGDDEGTQKGWKVATRKKRKARAPPPTLKQEVGAIIAIEPEGVRAIKQDE